QPPERVRGRGSGGGRRGVVRVRPGRRSRGAGGGPAGPATGHAAGQIRLPAEHRPPGLPGGTVRRRGPRPERAVLGGSRGTDRAGSGTMHKEVHDDGVRWMSAETAGFNRIADRVRRGEKMVLWATYYGANYRYLIEYGFGDDGTITCRIGPTGRNIFNRRTDG